MKRRLIITNTKSDHRAWLYDVIYTSKLSVAVVFLMFFCFLIQPFHQAAAAGDIPPEIESENAIADSVREQVEDATNQSTDEEEENEVNNTETGETNSILDQSLDTITDVDESSQPVGGSNTTSTTNQTNTANSLPAEATTSSTTSTQSTLLNNQSVTTTGENSVSDTATTTSYGGSTSSSSGSSTPATSNSSSTNSEADGQSNGGGSSSDSANTDDGSPEDEETGLNPTGDAQPVTDTSGEEDEVSESNTASSTTDADNIETPVMQAEILVNEDNFYQFSKQSCVAVGDGTYHCSSNEVDEFDTQAVVYSALGTNGNLEIYLQTSNGEIRQITDNEYDDSSPYFDAQSLQVVWQRLIDGRYQIILYDIIKEQESQLTFSRTNNMEPKVSSDGVVWQAWDNNDWEIMYFDGRFTDQITDNNVQDVAPVIQDRYILWTVIGRGEQQGKVYSLDSKELLTISGYDGGVIENPRFVLVYDTKFDNGDIITQGFDPTTGVSEPISAQPAPNPVDIPKTDPTGEIRALIQNKSSFEDELDKQLVHSDETSSTTATSSDTLNLKDDSVESVPITATSSEEVFELTEFDLILSDSKVNFEALEEIEDIIEAETDPENQESSTQD